MFVGTGQMDICYFNSIPQKKLGEIT
ncbi:uncharacterized protein METZ01_LOCUS345895 [marine metagenome]|uniref:Uncharacterized protein n=1 Tax=marine metagenome TaxID=408172 RepID=A0A382R901_9ZZZZ